MKKFRFTLDSVQILRQRQEQEATAKYAQALSNQKQAAFRLENSQQNLGIHRQEWRSQLAAGCTALAAAQAQGFHHSLEQQVEEGINALRIEEIRVNGALLELRESKRLSEIVDKFFEKQLKRHDYDCSVEEQKFMDDLALRGARVPAGAL